MPGRFIRSLSHPSYRVEAAVPTGIGNQGSLCELLILRAEARVERGRTRAGPPLRQTGRFGVEAAGVEPVKRGRRPKLTCLTTAGERQPNEVRLVEAAGVEPASESPSSWDSTCVSASFVSCPA